MNNPRLRLLSDVCQRPVSNTDPRRKPDHEFWYVDISSVDNTTKRIVSPKRVKGGDASVRARQVMRVNDVLVATTRPNLNAVALVPEQYDKEICSTGFCVLRAGAELDHEYLFYYVQSSCFVESLVDLTKGALYPAVTDRQVFAQTIPWVCVDKQRQIAARLKAQLAEVETARQAVQAQMRDADGLPFDALHNAPQKILGEWARTTSGSTPPRGDKRYWSPAEIPWVKTGEVAFAPIKRTEESISRLALRECSLTLLPPRSILIAMYGQGKTRGQSAMLEIGATTNQACFAILPNETWDADFLHHWLMASYEHLRRLSEGRGGNQANLNGKLLNALKIPAPTIAEQRRIVADLKSRLAQTDTLRNALTAQLAEINRLPSKLLAQAFTLQGETI